MGEVINVRCAACKKEWQCFTGNGLLHGRMEAVLAAFSEEERQQAERLMGAGPFPLYDLLQPGSLRALSQRSSCSRAAGRRQR